LLVNSKQPFKKLYFFTSPESLATTTHMPLTKKPEESGYQIGLTVAQLICKDKLQGSAMIDLLSSSAELDPEGSTRMKCRP